MSNVQTSPYSNYRVNARFDSKNGDLVSLRGEVQQPMQPDDQSGMSLQFAPPQFVYGHDGVSLVVDRTAVEVAIRRLTAEISHAKDELRELEEALLQELLKPPARQWLFPLMAVGLALSLYGSLTAVNVAEMGATGLMLLWSLSAFWLIYTGDKQQEKARNASKAEIEIWSDRIEELEHTLHRHEQLVDSIK